MSKSSVGDPTSTTKSCSTQPFRHCLVSSANSAANSASENDDDDDDDETIYVCIVKEQIEGWRIVDGCRRRLCLLQHCACGDDIPTELGIDDEGSKTWSN